MDALQAAVERWSLTLGKPYEQGAAGYTTRATLSEGTPVVLKLVHPHRESEHEADARRAWDGGGGGGAPRWGRGRGGPPPRRGRRRAFARALRAGDPTLVRGSGGGARRRDRPCRAPLPARPCGGLQ